MGSTTTISWCDASWNFIRGCSREIAVGAPTSGCGDQTGGGCYAERTGGRFCGPGLAYEGLVRLTPKGARWTGRVDVIGEHLLDPIRWRRARKIFVASVSDPFHPKLSNEVIAGAFGVMWLAPHHTFQSLTKRAARMKEWFDWLWDAAEAAEMDIERFCISSLRQLVANVCPDEIAYLDKVIARHQFTEGEVLPNLWLGVSAEHQWAWDERIPWLMQCPAMIRFVSVEPMIGPVAWDPRDHLLDQLDWIIVGCESGPRSRGCDIAWIRSVRDQCARDGIAFFLKQAMYDPTEDGFGQPAIHDLIENDVPTDPHRKGSGPIERPYLDGKQHLSFPIEHEA